MTEGLAQGYEKRNFDRGPATYNDSVFLQKIFNASGLRNTSGLTVLDAMSGPGKVGIGLSERASNNRFVFLDISQTQLHAISNGTAVGGDIRKPPFNNAFEVVVIRYGLKDLPLEEQQVALQEIYGALRPGGVLVVADMIALKDTKKWLNQQHSLKQQLQGRNIKEEGECYIPTEEEWLFLLKKAGFDAKIYDRHQSRVNTQDWVDSNQITDEQKKIIDTMIKAAGKKMKDIYHIREEAGQVMIRYPLTIFKAIKPCAINE